MQQYASISYIPFSNKYTSEFTVYTDRAIRVFFISFTLSRQKLFYKQKIIQYNIQYDSEISVCVNKDKRSVITLFFHLQTKASNENFLLNISE